jgi:hypothetical protein
MMPLLRLRGLIRLAVSVAAFTCVAVVAYEAGAHAVGKRISDAVTGAIDDSHCNGSPNVSEVHWSVTTHSDPNPESSVWRALDAQGELFASQAALFLGSDDVAAHHLHLAADALREDDQPRLKKAADELEKVARELEQGKASDEQVREALRHAFAATTNHQGGGS